MEAWQGASGGCAGATPGKENERLAAGLCWVGALQAALVKTGIPSEGRLRGCGGRRAALVAGVRSAPGGDLATCTCCCCCALVWVLWEGVVCERGSLLVNAFPEAPEPTAQQLSKVMAGVTAHDFCTARS